jgi:hypothetical protein
LTTRTVRFSVFSSAKDNQPKTQELSLVSFIQSLSGEPEISSSKEGGEAWSPAFYPPGATRKKDFVESLGCIGLDFDRGRDGEVGLTEADSGALFDWLEAEGLLYVSHNSYNSGAVYPREKLRVVLFFEREVTPTEYAHVWKDLYARLPVKPDKACSDVSRIYFSPRVPAEHVKYYQANTDGERLLPVRKVLPSLNGVHVSKNWTEAQWLDSIKNSTEKEPALNAAGFALGQLYSKQGRDLETAKDAIWSKCRASLQQNKISATVQSWEKAQATCIEAIEQGFGRYQDSLAVAEEQTASFSPEVKHVNKAIAQLKREVKLVEEDTEQLRHAAYRMGRFVPHVLSEEHVRRELVRAASQTQKSAYVPRSDAESIITAGIGAGKTNPRFVQTGDGWRSKLVLDTEGNVAASELNAKKIFQEHPAFAGKLRWSRRDNIPILTVEPPWENDIDSFPHRLTVSDPYDAGLWLAGPTVLGRTLPVTAVREALVGAASEDKYDPFLDWLESLVWDGQARLDNWVARFAGADESRYHALVGSKFLIAAVARTYVPNIEADSVLVLVGPERRGKSRLLKALGGEYFSDELRDITDKDSHLLMERFTIVEIAEIDKLMKWDDADLKSFITARSVYVRPSYERFARLIERRAVLAASTNEYEFLKSVTGNRRFWPVTVAKLCDVDGLLADRNQLWAEAVMRYRAGEKWWFENEEDFLTAEAKQEEVRVKDELEYRLGFLCGKRPKGGGLTDHTGQGVVWWDDQFGAEGAFMWVTNQQVCQMLLLEPEKRSEQVRVSRMLRALGWVSQTINLHGIRRRVYKRTLRGS